MKQQDKDNIVIHFKERIVTLHFEPIDSDIDIDDLVKIHYDNLIGEILTIATLMNRVGWLKAEAQDAVRQSSFELQIYEADIKEQYRRNSRSTSSDSKGNQKVKYATKDEVDNSVLQDPGYVNKRKQTMRIQKEYDYIDSLYWAVKSKDQKINRIADHLKPEEYEQEIVTGVVNGIMINVHRKLIS